MKPFDGDGVFWLPSDDETQLAGKVVFDPIKGATLSLFGAFEDCHQRTADGPSMLRIHGVAGRRYLTLEKCFPVDANREVPGITRQTFSVGAIITNHLFDEDEVLAFDEVSATFDQLATWIGRTGVTVNYNLRHGNQTADEVDIDFRQPDDEVVCLDEFQLRLTSSWGLRDRLTETQLSQGTYLTLRYPALRDLKVIWMTSKPFRTC